MKIHFEKANLSHIDSIFNWLAQPYIQEFWDNTSGHKEDILNFVNGRLEPSSYVGGKYVYWIARCDEQPFAMLMTIQETLAEDINKIKLINLSKTGHSYGIDYMIGDKAYFGKGYGARTLAEFIDFFRKEFDPKADTFLIDPASDNPRAKHVYMKAGFEYIADFIMSGNVSGAGKKHHLLIKRFPRPIQLNQKHFKSICLKLDLGCPKTVPERVYGGLLHLMWKVETNKGSYAIKQLSKDIDLTNEKIIKNYELSERITSRFIMQNIPAVSAIEKSAKYLMIIDGSAYLTYPWVDATALDQHTVSESHALKIAAILAKIHCINLDEPEVMQPEFYTISQEQILSLSDKAERFDCPFVEALQKNLSNLLAANEAYKNAVSTLRQQVVVSHGDLDQKNVLWDKNTNPILIDWESACKINPTYDLINTAFYWSGITTHFNKELFLKMINAYQIAGGVINKDHIIAACYGAFSWIGWLVYNIERSCVNGESESRTLGIEQVNQTLATILRLQRVIPELITLFKEKILWS